jgi:hypothetical protein
MKIALILKQPLKQNKTLAGAYQVPEVIIAQGDMAMHIWAAKKLDELMEEDATQRRSGDTQRIAWSHEIIDVKV